MGSLIPNHQPSCGFWKTAGVVRLAPPAESPSRLGAAGVWFFFDPVLVDVDPVWWYLIAVGGRKRGSKLVEEKGG